MNPPYQCCYGCPSLQRTIWVSALFSGAIESTFSEEGGEARSGTGRVTSSFMGCLARVDIDSVKTEPKLILKDEITDWIDDV